jgi:transposase
MRPAHVYASMSAAQHTELITALHGPWRNATRIMMVVLSAAGWSASEIADVLHYDPKTVRGWIARHRSEGLAGLPDRPRSGRPRKGSPRLGDRIHTLLQTPRSWTTVRIWKALGRPKLSLSTMRRRIREQVRWARPRLIAKVTRTATPSAPTSATGSPPYRPAVWSWPRTKPTSTCSPGSVPAGCPPACVTGS